MSKHTIQITIVDDSNGEKCAAECGVDWSSTAAITLANQRIKDKFGDRAQLEYIDLPKATGSQPVRELKQRIEALPLPLLLINGQPRVSGQFDIRQMTDAIEVDLEMGGES